MGSFLGMKMDQHWMDLFLWEKFLNEHPIKLLIEFGTGHGGLSTFLKLQCIQRGTAFMTFDNQLSVPFESPVPALIELRKSFHNKHIFADEIETLVSNELAARGHPACMFFDNGDKPREWRTFYPYATAGDYLVVHDWGTEFKAENITGLVTRIAESEKRSSHMTAWFQKT